MEENYTLSDIIEESDSDLNNIINFGIEAGIELAQDDGIDFTLECTISNGDSSEIESYKTRLIQKKLTSKDDSIINKYKVIK